MFHVCVSAAYMHACMHACVRVRVAAAVAAVRTLCDAVWALGVFCLAALRALCGYFLDFGRSNKKEREIEIARDSEREKEAQGFLQGDSCFVFVLTWNS